MNLVPVTQDLVSARAHVARTILALALPERDQNRLLEAISRLVVAYRDHALASVVALASSAEVL